jgi:hypothetical protein
VRRAHGLCSGPGNPPDEIRPEEISPERALWTNGEWRMFDKLVPSPWQWLSLVGIVLLVACRPGVPDPSGQEDIYLDAEIDRATIAPGEETTITFRLENVAATTVTLFFNSGCQIMPYVAAADTGSVVHPEGGTWACTMALTSLELPAGGTETRVLRVRAAAPDDPAVDTTDTHAVTLPPGEYVAYARLEDRVYQLVSTSVPFTVRE